MGTRSRAGFAYSFGMVKVEIYSSDWCPYCRRAKRLLKGKGVDYVEHNVDAVPGLRAEMVARADGRRTVPQVFVGGVHVGGSDDLAAWDRSGRLDELLEPGP